MTASASYATKVEVVAPLIGISSQRQTLPLRGSVVLAKFSACGFHGICFLGCVTCDVDIRKNLVSAHVTKGQTALLHPR